MSADTPALIVPIDLAALVVSDKDTVSGVAFADIAADFTNLPYPGTPLQGLPNLAQSALPQPFDPAAVPRRGIHLHWALPDALTHGTTNGDSRVTFPVAPDRWLVIRRAGAGGSTPAITAWVVESDHLWDPGESTGPDSVSNDSLKQNARSQAVPIDPPALPSAAKTFCAIGRVFRSRDWTGDRAPRCVLGKKADAGDTSLTVTDVAGWAANGNTVAMIHDGDATEAVVIQATTPNTGPGTLTLQAPLARTHRAGVAVDGYAGDRHTTLGYGTPAFAAAYPHCPNVFGFWDPADGLTATTVSYAVAGWYSNRDHDPLAGMVLPAAVEGRIIIDKHGWSFAAPASAAKDTTGQAASGLPDHIVCRGLLRGITWDPSKTFLRTRTGTSVDIAVGNTTAEAVAALLAARDDKIIPPALKPDFERLLEYFQLGLLRQLDQPDSAAAVDEARHQSHFGSESGGTTWVLQATKPSAAPPPAAAVAQLDSLNDQQQRCDGLAFEIESRRRQIFADWYKYMYVAYPPARSTPAVSIDDACNFVGNGAVPALDEAQGRFDREAGALSTMKTKVQAALNGSDFRLLPTGAPRYWRPSEPVILLSGDEVRPSPRYGGDGDGEPDGNLQCRVSTVAVPTDVNGFLAEVMRLDTGNPWAPPWIPLFLQWEAELVPQQPAGASQVEDEADFSYAPDFVEMNYSLGRDRLDLALVAGSGDGASRQASVYRGSAILAPRTEIHLAAQIKKYVDENPEDATAKKLAQLADALDLVAMAQSLTGFNEALLMRQQTLQLPVADPMETDEDRWIFNTTTVRNAVGDQNTLAPMPSYAFNPIRAGRLKLTKLRVVDAFGQVLNLIDAAAVPPLDRRMITAHDMKLDGIREPVLPPRLAQPARLMFRWLPADAAASSPICGWVLFNHLDDNLMVYDAAGNALGSLNVQGPLWQGAPGNVEAFGKTPADAIKNEYLKKFVLAVKDPAFLTAMLNAIDKTMTSINPLGYKQDQGVSLLIGQPLALVRASLRLELQGLPAIDESWSAYTAAVGAAGKGEYTIERRFDAGFTKVRFPVRLGDLGSHDDGLVGYYIDDGTDAAYTKLYCPAALLGSKGVVMPTDRSLMLSPVASGDPSPSTVVSMLIDPRGCVHATTGILPVKDISLPAAAYSRALRQMAVTFLTTPVLSGASLALPLPDEPGFTWQWVANSGQAGWPPPADIASPAADAAFASPTRIEEGWLKLAKDSTP